jgi:hypothetical protein
VKVVNVQAGPTSDLVSSFREGDGPSVGFWEVGEGEVGEAPRRGSGKEWSAKEGSEGEGFTCMQASGAVAVHVREFVWYLCHRLPPPILWRRGRGVGTATLTAPLN